MAINFFTVDYKSKIYPLNSAPFVIGKGGADLAGFIKVGETCVDELGLVEHYSKVSFSKGIKVESSEEISE